MRNTNGVRAVFAGLRRFVTGPAWRWPVMLSVAAACFRMIGGPTLAPHQWEECAVAFGIRPPENALSGIWRLMMGGLQTVLAPDAVMTLLWIGGAVSAGVLVGLSYALMDWLMPSLLRARLLATPNGLLWKRLLTGAGAMLFVCNDAVWYACQLQGAAVCQMLGTVAASALLVALLRRGRHYGISAATFALGLLTGDGLFAASLFAVALTFICVRASGKIGKVANELTNPIVMRAVTTRTACAYLAGLGAACVINVSVYRWLGGLSRTATPAGDLLYALVGDWLAALVAVFSVEATVFLLLFVIVPLSVICCAIPLLWPKTGVSSPLYLIPVVAAVAVALSQTTGFGVAEIWLPSARHAGDFARAVWTFGGLLVVVWGLASIVARAYTLADEMLGNMLTAAVGLVLAFAYASALPTQVRLLQGKLQDVVDTYCHEVAEECASDARVVTDGSLDEGVELAAWRQGRRLYAVSTASGDSPRDVKLRQRGVTDAEDLVALESSAADAMREWLEIRTNRLEGVAAQTVFDRRRSLENLKVSPRYSGLVAHFGGTDGAGERQGRQAAHALARRIINLCRQEDFTARIECAQLEAFRRVQWRVAEACRQRTRNPKATADELTEDAALAEALDQLNPELETIRRQFGWQAARHGAMILPREGVRIALAKSDFRLASLFAERVLKLAPDDAEANFAMGMNHYLNRQFARAVPHLQRVLADQGENPGVLNNLAMAYLRLERWDEAIATAERALRAAPNDEMIRRSTDRICRQARAHVGGSEP